MSGNRQEQFLALLLQLVTHAQTAVGSVGTTFSSGQMKRFCSRRFISSRNPLRSQPRILIRLR
jgi:hypothetical protein